MSTGFYKKTFFKKRKKWIIFLIFIKLWDTTISLYKRTQNEYSKINLVNSPRLPQTTNPHNMYTLVLVQLGLIGLFSMLSIFYYQIKLSFTSSNKFIRDVGMTLPLIFLVMMLSDSYLLGHYTTLLFVFFSSFLYKNFEEK